jgi:putative OPT family oligopeptide transporter
MVLLQNAYGIGTPVREGVPALKAPQGVMFEKLVGGIFGEAGDLPWDLVGWGALVGALAIVIDVVVLAPRKTKFRLHAMPLAVGMYLPWTVTTPILIGGLVYRFVEHRSKARGDDEGGLKAVIHRGLLFSSGLVAGEAIAGIAIAFLVVANLDLPMLRGWLAGGAIVDVVSLLGLSAVIWLLVRKALGGGKAAQA